MTVRTCCLAGMFTIGVDIEYSNTRIVIINLAGAIVEDISLATPRNPTEIELTNFLVTSISDFVDKFAVDLKNVLGVGIGIPGVIVPSWVKPDMGHELRSFEEKIGSTLDVPVRCDINVRAYTIFHRWEQPLFPERDFILVSIRTGVGAGVIFDGELFRGSQNIAAELGHMKVADEG